MPSTPSTHRIAILGAGHIGFAMAVLLQEVGEYRITVADRDPEALARAAALGVGTVLLQDDGALEAAVTGQFAVLNALPFHRAVPVATLCARHGVHYFDLTEDVRSTQAIRALAQDARSVLMPQCGLAPGFIGVVGNDLAQRFDTLHDLRMRVGALPRYPLGALRYNLTWSTEGLINEYCNPCEAIVDGQPTTVAALDGLETFALDGVEYEAFNTSGGLGTLPETWAGRARRMDYQSIRYPGHCAILKLLLNDLRLRDRRDLLKDIFEAAIPATEQDVIVVFASASGLRGGRLVQDAYSARIVGATVGGHALNAIQLTTAASICAALDLVVQGRLPQSGFIRQEQIALGDFLGNRFGRAYRDHALAQAEGVAAA
ncbi:saccharopine dehydrogenase NADP-binding domain-containing protein [Acidovorax sp. SUPP2522]|uniref:saccharopine dehydrogenase family protein n=1 Tax=unclassified Acidovorax TaxID=2684926 RepID=UPI00234BDF9D|nr:MULTISPECIES: saccharopine dehydrogenase NADP-binding domain-containing protein [unclassified Acidovorax]WCN00231.1 saccharopine dehydrogenase NADP-binding domain-containing protein [Acidovorax sp. GBBC 1281]GKT17272.1 saccharopine dehydrogenase NADP-binding domain-containing protein [Acidovorax sp. SUPP2522]